MRRRLEPNYIKVDYRAQFCPGALYMCVKEVYDSSLCRLAKCSIALQSQTCPVYGVQEGRYTAPKSTVESGRSCGNSRSLWSVVMKRGYRS